ncbi:MAG: hypothetical protein AAF733_06935 [Verrucomicrobiota bacterium]
MNSRIVISLFAFLVSIPSGVLAASPDTGELLFEVRFTREGVAFAGRMDTEENALELAESVQSVRPDLPILNHGLQIDETAQTPSLSDLKSLLAELGLSTHGGRVSLYENSVEIGGMTDSRISLTALRIRLQPILNGRPLVNRLCIVSEGDMPKLQVQLSSGETAGPLLNFDVIPTAAESFELPGLSLANLFPMVLTLSDLSRLNGTANENSIGKKLATLQAVPLVRTNEPPGKPERGVPAVLRAIPAEPQPLLVSLSSLFYTRHSFLLQANQDEKIEEIVKQLSAPPLSGHTLLLRAVKSNAQGNAYGDYLVEKRGNAAKELLTERGIPEARITLDPITLSSRVDTGEVRLVVRIPPTQSESSEDSDSPAEVDAQTPDRVIVEGSP